MHGQIMIYSYNEILLSCKKNKLLKRAIIWINLKSNMPSERNQTQKTVLYILNSIHMKFLKRQNYNKVV